MSPADSRRPPPWTLTNDGEYHIVRDANGQCLTTIPLDDPRPGVIEEMVRCVNAHEALVAALKAVLAHSLMGDDVRFPAMDALKLAGESDV